MASVPLPSRKPKARRSDKAHGIIAFPNASGGTITGQEIIRTVENQKIVRELLLQRVRLRESCCIELFEYLCSLPKSKRTIVEVDLRGCGVTDAGLMALSKFLRNNTALKTLWLQNNCFSFSSEAAQAFVAAINSSHLTILRLSSNPNRNGFVPFFLRTLDSKYLNVLELSTMSIDSECISDIAAYLASPRCYLATLRLNGNTLTIEALQELHCGLKHNYTLTYLETHACVPIEDANDAELAKLTQERSTLLTRNEILQRNVREEALSLLRHSRAALLLSSRSSSASSSSSPSPFGQPSTTLPQAQPHRSRFPTELILHILSFFAPTLSPTQRIHIFTYASQQSTLPPLLPRLSSSSSSPSCLPDPSAFPSPDTRVACSEACCMGSGHYLSCRRESERAEWLRDVGCLAYDPTRPRSILMPVSTREGGEDVANGGRESDVSTREGGADDGKDQPKGERSVR